MSTTHGAAKWSEKVFFGFDCESLPRPWRLRQSTSEDGSRPFRGRLKDSLHRSFFCGDVGVNLLAVGVVVGQSRMNLRQREMLDLGYDLLGCQTQIVPPRY